MKDRKDQYTAPSQQGSKGANDKRDTYRRLAQNARDEATAIYELANRRNPEEHHTRLSNPPKGSGQ